MGLPGVRPKGCRICRVPRAPCFPLIDFEGNHVSVSFEHDPSAYMLLILGNQQHLLRSCLTTGDLDGGPQPLKRKALIDTPPYRYWRCSRLLGLQFVTVLTSAALFGGKATLSQAARSGLTAVILADSSASTPMKYLDDFVDSLGVVDHSMAAGDDAF